MKITWFGTASLALESNSGTKLLLDPFLRMNKRLQPIPLADYMGYDAILLTHGHVDHIYHVPKVAAADKNVPVYCTAAPARSLRLMGVDERRIRRIKPDDSFTVGDIEITARPGRHVRFNLPYIAASAPQCILRPVKAALLIASGVTLPEKGEILIFEIRCDGKTVTVMGSFGVDRRVTYREAPDVLVLPYNGSTKIPALADAPLKEIRPKLVFFDHYDDAFPPLTRRMDVENYEQRLRKDFPDLQTLIPEEHRAYAF